MRAIAIISASLFLCFCLYHALLLGAVAIDTWGDEMLPTNEARYAFSLAVICIYAAIAAFSVIRSGDVP